MARRPPSFLSRPHCSPKLQYDLKPQHVNASTRITLDQRALKNWISKHGPDSTPMTDNRPITDRFSVRSASPAPAVSDEPVHRIFMSKPRHVPALFPASGQQHIVPAPPKLTFPGFKGNWALHGSHYVGSPDATPERADHADGVLVLYTVQPQPRHICTYTRFEEPL
jgi:hypothetical protein